MTPCSMVRCAEEEEEEEEGGEGTRFRPNRPAADMENLNFG